MKLLQIDFPYTGPWSADMAQALQPLAQDIAGEPGLLWKLWTESESDGRAGGVYAFSSAEERERYLAKHTARLEGFGVREIRAQRFDVNAALSALTRGPGV